ncbi:MAG: phosphoenolpyruvate carboxykinase (ATP), partial [Flavobacteriales bacterium]
MNADLKSIGLDRVANAYWNLTPSELVEESIILGQGTLTSTGALAIDTGEFTGRSPQDRFIVLDDITRNNVWWGDINKPFDSEAFDRLYDRMAAYLTGRDVYVRDAFACADMAHRMPLRVVTEYPWSNQFASNMFIRPNSAEIPVFEPDWHVICAPGFHAVPDID